MKTIGQIIKEYLESVGADGLCNTDLDCGCPIDGMCQCESNPSECVPAKSHIVTNRDKEEGYFESSEEGDTVYVAMKPEQSTKRGI